MPVRSVGRKKKILEATRALLIEQGYDRMTFKMVANRSGAAVGSIIHFYKTKEALAAAAAKDLVDELVVAAEAALKGHDVDAGRAVRSLIMVCSGWPQKFPHHCALAGYLELGQPPTLGAAAECLQARLEAVLAVWARPLIQHGKIAPLSSAQLYAVTIAPAICDVRSPVNHAPTKSEVDWIESLATAALVVLKPATKRSVAIPKTEPAVGSLL